MPALAMEITPIIQAASAINFGARRIPRFLTEDSVCASVLMVVTAPGIHGRIPLQIERLN
jgi:hypothetical protein